MSLLKAEQVDGDSKRVRCLENFKKTEDDAKELANTIAVNKDAIQEFQTSCLAQMPGSMSVQKSIAELDASVAKAIEIRQEQHAEFV